MELHGYHIAPGEAVADLTFYKSDGSANLTDRNEVALAVADWSLSTTDFTWLV